MGYKTHWLDTINCPADLRRVPLEELPLLAQEVRDRLLACVSKTGGHLASSLGATELTIAIHRVFEAPHDRIVWDTGHQAYVHKLFTGRREQLSTLRQHGGISGFLRRVESPYDVFGAGHAGTAISAALGTAEGIRLRSGDERVVAILGDAALTAGIAFEGLNQAGTRGKNLIVVLNDNEMSISPNVGALNSFMSRKLTSPFFRKIKDEAKFFLRSVPGIGEDLVHWAKRWEEAVKTFFSPGILFEALGFKYIGPIPGHDVIPLVETFENVKRLEGPILVHVLTQKGKGYAPAEENPVAYHGVTSFDVRSGKSTEKKAKAPSYTEVFARAMIKLAHADPRVIGITAAMPSGTGLDRFGKEFPDRFYDVGIAEQHAITFSAGLATEGFRPVAAIYSTFLQRAYDQIIHDVCIQDLPVTFALDRGGLVGADGATHQGLFDISYLRTIPNVIVMAPKDENELQHMLKTAVECGHPAALRYPRGNGLGVPLDEDLKEIEIGKGELLRDGTDAALIAFGVMVKPALDAAEILEAEGIQVAVVNARFAKPLDADLIGLLARRTGRIVTIEEHVRMGGFGSAVLEALSDLGLHGVKTQVLGIGDAFIEHGPTEVFHEQFGLRPAQIAQTVRALLGPEKEK
ncbi:MAG: 1-deoxy-D-xylulose-5-phosphate synthase [Deltaproteobacteria bacterium RBG_13_65_10]|nr:MAG: 1-deoxy-D-xylulose-5-phosphate synthase [Deltaproteobacteria bacterium RBG_13_65_10]